MKELTIMMACLFFYQFLQAQTFSEWFEQNRTQLRYLGEQIAALQAYNVTQTDGYMAADTGLAVINATEDEDFDEHRDYFESLRQVRLAILDDPMVGDIASFCDKASTIGEMIRLSGDSLETSIGEMRFREGFASRLNRNLESLTERLADLITPGILEMTDAERRTGIFKLEREAENIYVGAFNYLAYIIKS